MADVSLAVQDVSDAGVVPTFTGGLSISDTYLVNNNGRVVLYVKNGGAGSINVTIQTPITVGSLTVEERIVAVVNASEKIIGPFPVNVYNTPGTHTLKFTLSGVTTVTVAALRI